MTHSIGNFEHGFIGEERDKMTDPERMTNHELKQRLYQLAGSLNEAHEILKLFIDKRCAGGRLGKLCNWCGTKWPCRHELARRFVEGK